MYILIFFLFSYCIGFIVALDQFIAKFMNTYYYYYYYYIKDSPHSY